MKIAPLDLNDFPALHACWVVAFGDYKVPIDLSPADLEIMLRQNGIDFPLSVAAYDGDRMIGFL